jgi:hypothetical protein
MQRRITGQGVKNKWKVLKSVGRYLPSFSNVEFYGGAEKNYKQCDLSQPIQQKCLHLGCQKYEKNSSTSQTRFIPNQLHFLFPPTYFGCELQPFSGSYK